MDLNNPREFLKQIATELHKRARKSYPTRMVKAPAMDYTWSGDLSDMKTWMDKNDDYRYIFACVDVVTRYAWARPMKTKTTEDILAALGSIIEEPSPMPGGDGFRKPKFLWIDQEAGMLSKEMSKWLQQHNIQVYHTFSVRKSVIVERFFRTLKSLMWKELTALNSVRWIDILEELISKYNHTTHGPMGMTPFYASRHPEEAQKVWMKRFLQRPRPTAPVFHVGDKVRVSRQKGQFEKESDISWSREIYTVRKVDASKYPPVYHLEDEQKEPITGSFYAEELQKTKVGDIFLVEKVLQEKKVRGRTQILVKWLGYPDKFNSWIWKDESIKL